MVDEHFWDFQIYPKTNESEDETDNETDEEKFFTSRMKKKGYLAICLEREAKNDSNNKK